MISDIHTFLILLPPGDLNPSFRTLANTRHQGVPPGSATRGTSDSRSILLKGVAGRAVAFLNVDSLKHRKLELRDENKKSTIFFI